MSNKADRRKSLFLRGAEAWQRVSGDAGQLYVCPLCIRGFTIHAIATRDLSLEHVPPRALGGKPIALTCKECNSRAGHSVDAASNALERLAALSEAMTPTGDKVTGTGKLQLDQLPPVNVQYNAERGNIRFNVSLPRNNPKSFERHFAAVDEAIKSGRTGEFKHRFTPDISYQAKRALVSHLRAAYLILFSGLGYRYALSQALETVRGQLKNFDQPLVEHAWIRNDEKLKRPPLILGVSEPARAFAVVLRRVTVIMPTLEGPADPWKIFATAGENSGGRVTLTGRELGWPAGLEMQYDFS